ncbi:MATE family efflux transporter [Paracoccus tegillarcae]|uniref:Multidrug-efflux transporter n=1 Tax=Paracoccus tegillarcae TaxID=1529068 RepID=A0A2K9EJN4_9RHOB|nr:MATE family efflux transporter [Paracoccus tegillarcae]AUH34599.1 MATE family efflux transporter [Paracoccus tegillarcae]
MNFTRLRPELIAMTALGLPLVGSHVARMAIGVSDTVMVGWYGVEALAALVLASSLFMLLFLLGSGYSIGGAGLIAGARARGDDTEVRRVTRMALWLSVLHGLLMAPLMWWSGPILNALGQDPQVSALAQTYLRIMIPAMPLVLAGMVINSYLSALGRPNAVMWITLAGLPLNILLNWMFIFGNWGAPELGIAGSAIASLTVNAAQLVALMGYALWLPQARRYNLMQRFWRPDWPGFFSVFKLGLPIGAAIVAEVALFAGTNIMMGWIGTTELAAHGIALQITSIAFMVHLGLSSAATIRAGEAFGRGDFVALRDIASAVIMLSLGFAVIVIAIFILWPDELVLLYLDQANPASDAILAVAVGLMFWAAVFQLADALQVILQGLLRGVQDTRVPLIMAIIGYWCVGLTCCYLFAFPLGMGPPGLWVGLLAGLSVASVLLYWRFYQGLARGGWTRQVLAR